MIEFFQDYFGANNYKNNDLNSNNTSLNDGNPSKMISDAASNAFSASEEPGPVLSLSNREILEASGPDMNLIRFMPESDHFHEASAPDFNLINFDPAATEKVEGPDVSDIEEEADGPGVPDMDEANTDDLEDQMEIGPEEVECFEEEGSEVEGCEEEGSEEEEVEGPFSNDEIHNGNHSTAYNLAKIYLKSADAGVKVAKKTGCGIARFTSAFSRTTVRAWNLGAKQCVKNIGKESMGSKHYANALNTLKSSLSGQNPSRTRLGERMGISETLGEASAHVCKGLGTAAFTGMYAFGTISNLLNYKPTDVSFHTAASTLASNVNNATGTVLSLGSQVVFPLIESIVTDPIATVNNAWTVGCLGVTAAVMGTSLYYASSSFTKAADSQSYLSKVKHSAIVVASLVATVAIPCLMCTS